MLKKQICLTVSTLLLAAAMLPARAQAPLRGDAPVPVTSDMRPHTNQKIIIPELTEVKIILKDLIKTTTRKGRVGDELLFFVAQDVYGPGHTLLLARNTPVLGEIAESHGTQGGRRGQLCLRCDYVLAQDKTRIPLTGVHQEVRLDSQDQDDDPTIIRKIDIGVTVDVFSPNKNAKLPIGKIYSVYVDADTQTEAPMPFVDGDALDSAPQEAFVLLKDGNWAIGLFRQVGNTYVLTNSGGSQTVKIADVRSLEFLKDVKVPYNGK